MRGALAVLGVVLVACSAGFQERMRGRTYPPDFNYVPQDQLESTMWQLAGYMAELDTLMREPDDPNAPQRPLNRPLRDIDPGDEALQRKVVLLLLEMERVIEPLGQGGWPSNHPRIGQNIGRFRRDLEGARLAASSFPPNYYRAGTVTGSCMYCHGN